MATTYYVSSSDGNDGNSGLTEDLAWATFNGNVNNTSKFTADDTVKFKCGDTFNDAGDWEFRSTGTSSGYITLTSYGTGAKPIFSIPNNNTTGLLVNGRNYIIFDGIDFQDGMVDKIKLQLMSATNCIVRNCDFSGNVTDHALRVYGGSCENLTIDNCTFTDAGHLDVIRIYATTPEAINNITVSNCTIVGTAGNGIYIYCDESINDAGYKPQNITIDNNSISDTGYCAIVAVMDNSTISNNICTNIGYITTPNINAIQLGDCDDCIIEGNSISTVRTSVPDGSGIILDFAYADDDHITERAIVRNNYIYDCNDGAGVSTYKSANCIIYNNIIVNCDQGMSGANSNSVNNLFYNNVIYNPTDNCLKLRSSSTAVAYNNIFYGAVGSGVRLETGATVTEDYNCYYDCGTNFTGGVIGANSFESDPLFRSPTDYHLQKTSPCRDSGTLISSITTDYEGNPRKMGSGQDMGAYEYYKARIKNATLR
jgi:hypothetical protein